MQGESSVCGGLQPVHHPHGLPNYLSPCKCNMADVLLCAQEGVSSLRARTELTCNYLVASLVTQSYRRTIVSYKMAVSHCSHHVDAAHRP